MKRTLIVLRIMSLAGIAIAIGTMVDMGIIILENIYEHLADWENEEEALLDVTEREESRLAVIRRASIEVAPAIVTAVSTTIVSFLPVFFLTGRDQRLFSPLAWTKTYAIVASLLVAITVVTALSVLSGVPALLDPPSTSIAVLVVVLGVLGVATIAILTRPALRAELH